MVCYEFGVFDIVLFLGVLYHVKHPVLALENVCGMCRDMACIESFVTGTDPTAIPVIAPDVADWLQSRKVRLIGLDLPSVDRIDAKVLQNHHALARCRIAIVESLDLSAVEPGIYNFAALPLKIIGGDAAPVRAMLWRE